MINTAIRQSGCSGNSAGARRQRVGGRLTVWGGLNIIGAVAGEGSASIRDVARSAGVSHMTVSRVINGRPGVSEPTRRRVLAAIRELDFRPSRVARELSRGRSLSVTVMTSDTTLYGRAALLQ